MIVEDSLAVSKGQGSIETNASNDWTFTPNANFNGPVELTYKVSDGTTDVSRTATFEVVSINDIPTLNASPQSLPDGEEDVVYTINANTLLDNYSDVEGNTLSIVSLSAAGGEINETSTGIWEFTPAKDYSGDVKINYVISDGNNGYALGETTVNLLAVNDLSLIHI